MNINNIVENLVDTSDIQFALMDLCGDPVALQIERDDKYKIDHVVSIYFGVPGSGKTTFAAWLARRDLKHGHKVWSNTPIKGCYKFDKSDLGVYDISDGRILWDETGIDADNRNYKTNFTKEQVEYLKKHRHYQVALDCFSQGVDDMDKKLRVLSQRIYVVKRSLIPQFCYTKQIIKTIDIHPVEKTIIDAYEWKKFSRKYIYCPAVWPMFDTIERKELPSKDWEVY